MICKACNKEINENTSRCRYCGSRVTIGKYEREKIERDKNKNNQDIEYHEIIRDTSGTIDLPLVVTITLSVIIVFFIITGLNNFK